jgi:1,4-alpha-glucan branching enzyme
MVDPSEAGAFAGAANGDGVPVRFGLFLPGIDQAAGFGVRVLVVNRQDRFDPAVRALPFTLDRVAGNQDGLWRADVTTPLKAGASFGQPGTYLYHYQLLQNLPGSATPRIVTRWFTDPFARETDVGELSAFTTPDAAAPFAWSDGWKVPELDDLVVYELQVEQFNSTFDGVVERLTYLRSLGVNCLELMPVSSVKLDFDWGYGPLHYFAPNQRWGGGSGLKRLVDACHAAGVAVILDVVYQHVDWNFPYHLVYSDAGVPSPMIAGSGEFGPEIDYSQEFAREYVLAANLHWLDEYHVDGFRYDEVTDLYDGPLGVKYPKLAYDTYGASLQIPRFTPSGGTKPGEYSRIIQCAEAINQPREILRNTYSTSTWQDELLGKAEDMAQHGYVDDAFAHLLDPGFSGYPATKTVHDIAGAAVDMPVAPFQYLDSHDHSPLLAFLGGPPPSGVFADRAPFYRLQPFAIALLTCQGTPMLWQGQEFAENYVLPPSGDLRVHFRRDLHWEYFYDVGAALVRLYRVLGRLRRTTPALRGRESFYDNVNSRPSDGVIIYHRRSTAANQVAVVVLNFSGSTRTVAIPFPDAGEYREVVDDDVRTVPLLISIAAAGDTATVDVPSNYGYILLRG